MSEAVAVHDTTGPSAGAVLRHARESAGLHVAALAGALKVPQRQIEALEQDRLDLLPDVVYARALAASICRNLRVDPQVVLTRLPKGEDSRLGQNEPINVPFRASGDIARSGWRDLLGRPAALAALVLLVGAIVLLLLPLIPNRSAQPVSAPDASSPQVPVSGDGAPLPTVTPGLVSESVTPSGVGTPADSASGTPPAPAAATAPPAPSTSVATSETPTAPAAGASVIVLRASQPSWVQVTGPGGAVHLRRMLAAGETVNISGATPLAVVVGSANTTQVQVRGQSFNLAPHTRDNVARFEVR